MTHIQRQSLPPPSHFGEGVEDYFEYLSSSDDTLSSSSTDTSTDGEDYEESEEEDEESEFESCSDDGGSYDDRVTDEGGDRSRRRMQASAHSPFHDDNRVQVRAGAPSPPPRRRPITKSEASFLAVITDFNKAHGRGDTHQGYGRAAGVSSEPFDDCHPSDDFGRGWRRGPGDEENGEASNCCGTTADSCSSWARVVSKSVRADVLRQPVAFATRVVFTFFVVACVGCALVLLMLAKTKILGIVGNPYRV